MRFDKETIKKIQEAIERDFSNKKRYVEKLAALSKEQRKEFIEKCIDKYNSDKYKLREYRMGIEPRCPLYNIIYEYAQEYGKELPANEDFLVDRYEFDNYWIVDYYFGQGSYIQIYHKEKQN